MKSVTPLRYPGGKTSLAGLLSDIIRLNDLGARRYVEPFAGGAGAALQLLMKERVAAIGLNDLDSGVFSFWWSVTHKHEQLVVRTKRAPLTVAQWWKQKATLQRHRASRVDRGFAAFFLNRCNRSGIIMRAGPIGGFEQTGRWKIDARFNRSELVRRIRTIAEYSDRIEVTSCDAIDLIKQTNMAGTFFFIDPPYYHKGQELYLNALDHKYHAALAKLLRENREHAWIVTYDDCPEIRKLYSGWACVRPFTLQYSAATRRRAGEVLIAPKWMRLPVSQTSRAVDW